MGGCMELENYIPGSGVERHRDRMELPSMKGKQREQA
jgi:hypothetical protein